MRGGARHVAGSLPAPGTGRPGQPGRVGRAGRVLRRAAGGLVVVLALVAGAGAAAAWRLQSNIGKEDVTRKLGDDRPTAAPTDSGGHVPVTVLVLGSDSRQGANGFVGGKADEGRSDTTLLLHLSADRSRALAVSIPRDSMVEMPSCIDREGLTSPEGMRQFNDAFTIGGAGCTQRTLEQLTGVRIDHYAVVDFAGFKGMVDALGGVPICLPKAVNDTRHHIELPAGRSRVDGTKALAYVRERYVLGDGSDLGRIQRQHAFIASVLQEATSAGTLTNPPKLYSFLSAATRSVTMDPELASLPTLAGFAKEVSDIGLEKISFVTVPVEEYPPDHNRLQWAPGASRLWKAIRTDAPLTFGGTPSSRPSRPSTSPPTGTSTTGAPGTVDPAQVRVRVVNASGVAGRGSSIAADLRDGGWNVVGVSSASGADAARTRVVHGPGRTALARAKALAAWVPGAEVVEEPGAGSTVRLEIGTDRSGVTDPSASAGTARAVVVPGVQARTADADICG